ncbi:MAG: DUF1839 family protein [Gammaproteobacteria bacterium]
MSGTPAARRAIARTGLDSADYRRHWLHGPERLWAEKNCYIDIWIELLHALELEPLAMLAFTVGIDFEGDQWTFFKPPHADLKRLYGIDVQELYVWRPLLDHALEHLAGGKFISTEADAFWLPDTAGTDYRRQHVKTTIVIGAIDLEAQRLSYFHNGGYFRLDGEDFVNTFGLGAVRDAADLPLFAELVRCDRLKRIPVEALRRASFGLLREHVAWLPAANPIHRFRQRLDADLPLMLEQGLPYFHAWVFGTLRQLGAASELSALYLRWLGPEFVTDLESAADAFTQISTTCKALIMKIARCVSGRRPLDAAANFEEMGAAWERASSGLSAIR